MAWIYKGAPAAVPAEMWSKYSDMRFGFDGQLLTNPEGTNSIVLLCASFAYSHAGAAVPMHAGLHHHGDAPQAAGYNLKEVFFC